MSRFDGLLDTLREAKRYVRSSPDEAIRLARDAIEALWEVQQARPKQSGHNMTARLDNNIESGIHFINVAPDVLKGYLDGAILEIQNHASRENK